MIFVTVITLFLVFAMLDYLLHGLILGWVYRGMALMIFNEPLWMFFSVSYAILFVYFFKICVENKSVKSGAIFGLYFGFASSIGQSSLYLYMPISEGLVWGWFFGLTLKSVIGGLIIGYFLKDH